MEVKTFFPGMDSHWVNSGSLERILKSENNGDIRGKMCLESVKTAYICILLFFLDHNFEQI